MHLRKFFAFWWKCARTALSGNTAFANDWQWVFGIPLVSGISVWANARYGAEVMSTGSPITDGFLGAFGAFVVTWIIAFTVRFANAPVALYHGEKDRSDKLEGLRQAAKDDPLQQLVRKRDRFTIAEAACLLAQTDLKQDNLVGPASAYLHDIRKQILNEKIRPLNAHQNELTLAKMENNPIFATGEQHRLRTTIEISKDALRKLAKAHDINIPGL